MVERGKLPWWLKPANRVVTILKQRGLALSTQHILSISGKKTGRLWSTPVALLAVGSRNYVVTSFEADWIKNARAASWGLFARGRIQREGSLFELPVE